MSYDHVLTPFRRADRDLLLPLDRVSFHYRESIFSSCFPRPALAQIKCQFGEKKQLTEGGC